VANINGFSPIFLFSPKLGLHAVLTYTKIRFQVEKFFILPPPLVLVYFKNDMFDVNELPAFLFGWCDIYLVTFLAFPGKISNIQQHFINNLS
jgi:hypothetical protein